MPSVQAWSVSAYVANILKESPLLTPKVVVLFLVFLPL